MRLALQARLLLLFTLVVGISSRARAQQYDEAYEPEVAEPAHGEGAGPVVGIDEAHHNNVADGRWVPFAKLLRKDGYRVRPFASKFTPESLKRVDVLVVANALSERNAGWKPGQPEGENKWALPTHPAFEESEVDAVEAWVKGGGSLLLLAGHMPWPGAAEKLAERFDVLFHNGFAFPIEPASGEVMTAMPPKEGAKGYLLADHPILSGRSPRERVVKLEKPAGMQAFRPRPGGKARPLLVLDGPCVLLLPEVPWRFTEKTPRVRADGMLAGAALTLGKGRVVLLGVNARALSATRLPPDRRPYGINNPDVHNARFVLNTMHWLSRLLPAE